MFEPQTHVAGYRHLRPDLRGFGNAPAPEGDMSMASYARDLLASIDADRFVLAGFSMGGYIAMELLRQVPERIAALLLLDTRETPDTEPPRNLLSPNGIGGFRRPSPSAARSATSRRTTSRRTAPAT